MEDALHLWSACLATQSLGVGGDSTRGPISWSPTQLCRFLRVPLIALLMDQDGVEHPGGLTPNSGVGP